MRRGVVLLVLGLAAVAAVAGPFVVAGVLSRPARAVVDPPPPDLGAVAVRVRTAGTGYVAGWLARGRPGGGAVLLLHPVRADRRAMVGRARVLRAAGYTVLLVDLPAHGESPGTHVTFGARESAGARAALAYLRAAAPGERVGALGVSLGGAALLLGDGPPAAAAADAVVLEMVYPDIRDAVADRLRIRRARSARRSRRCSPGNSGRGSGSAPRTCGPSRVSGRCARRCSSWPATATGTRRRPRRGRCTPA